MENKTFVFIGAGTGLFSAAAIYKKKNDASDRDQETKYR